MGGDLDDDVGVRNVDGCITHSGEDNAIELCSISEFCNDVLSLLFTDLSGNVGDLEPLTEFLQAKELITEDDDLVASCYMQLDQVVTSHQLVRIIKV